MIAQRMLLRLHRSRALAAPLRRLLEQRTWRVESGEAAGLRLAFPQNLDFLRGSTEPPIQRRIVDHLRPGDVFYDIGANVGFFSLLAARCVGSVGAVYAFEPVAANAAAVRKNARLNDVDNIAVFEVAVDARPGRSELFLTHWDGGATLWPGAVPPKETVHRTMVDVVALDDFIATQGLRPPTLVKIDVEGVEHGVIQGMLSTIARYRPMLIYEVDDGNQAAFRRRWTDLDRFVAGLGYRVERLQNSYPNTVWHVGHSYARPLQDAADEGFA